MRSSVAVSLEQTAEGTVVFECSLEVSVGSDGATLPTTPAPHRPVHGTAQSIGHESWGPVCCHCRPSEMRTFLY